MGEWEKGTRVNKVQADKKNEAEGSKSRGQPSASRQPGSAASQLIPHRLLATTS